MYSTLMKKNWRHVGPGLGDLEKEIVFVCGPARGGTTLLNNLLNRCFDYGTCSEGTFVLEFAKKAKGYGDLSIDANLGSLVGDLAECRMLQIERQKKRPIDVTADMIRERMSERSYAGAVYAVFRAIADAQNRHRVGNKNPGYWRYFDLLDHLFPTQAKYLCIMRDGRDVALSHQGVKWGRSSVYAVARGYQLYCRAIDAYRRAAPPGRLMVVRYEDLLQRPEICFRQIRDFLDPEISDSAVDNAVNYIRENGKTGNFDKWRHQMPPDDIRIFEALAGAELLRHGYALQYQNPTVGMLNHLRYRSRESWRLIKLNLKTH